MNRSSNTITPKMWFHSYADIFRLLGFGLTGAYCHHIGMYSINSNDVFQMNYLSPRPLGISGQKKRGMMEISSVVGTDEYLFKSSFTMN